MDKFFLKKRKKRKPKTSIEAETYLCIVVLFLLHFCYCLLDQLFRLLTVALVVHHSLKKDSPLAADISTALLELSENHTLQNISKTWPGSKRPCGR